MNTLLESTSRESSAVRVLESCTSRLWDIDGHLELVRAKKAAARDWQWAIAAGLVRPKTEDEIKEDIAAIPEEKTVDPNRAKVEGRYTREYREGKAAEYKSLLANGFSKNRAADMCGHGYRNLSSWANKFNV